MKDLFGDNSFMKPIRINIYADEVQGKLCPYTKNEWDYIGIIIERIGSPLVTDILNERFMGNYDTKSPYYFKNDKIVHWSEIRIADTKNICKRWFQYLMDPAKSGGKVYSYILGINRSFLVKSEFDKSSEFNSIYNRFFRSAILYSIRTLFNNKSVVIENIYHEEGQQQYHEYFPWHVIFKLKEANIGFECDRIIFLSKDHRNDKRSNIIQFCDCLLGASTSLIHGIDKSKSSKCREELMELFSPLLERMMREPNNPNSRYAHRNRIMIRFFPKEKTYRDELSRQANHFYSKRTLYYNEQQSSQQLLF